MEKKLGKILSVRIGYGGYQDAMIGLEIEVGNEDWTFFDFDGFWGTKWRESCKWTEEDRIYKLGAIFWKIHILLCDAKKKNLHELVGIPIEMVIENGKYKSWRILKEVI